MAKTDSKKEDQKDPLAEALAAIDKAYGKGSTITGNEIVAVERRSTGSIGLDIITGGGYGKGRIVEVYGIESGGKSTITLHAIAEAQRNGEIAALVDSECSYDREYAEALGVDNSKLIFSQPDFGEQALDITEKLAASGRVGLIVVDSVAALVPKAELEGEMTDSHMGVQARMMGKAMRKLVGVVGKTGTTLIFINQTRQNIGGYGQSLVTPGGGALKFAASIRMEVSKKTGDKSKDGSIEYNTVTVTTKKNKLAPPFQTTSFDINFGEGISKISEVLNYGLQLGMIVRGGSWYSYGDTKLGQGETAVEDYLTSNPEILEELELNIREHYNIHIQ